MKKKKILFSREEKVIARASEVLSSDLFPEGKAREEYSHLFDQYKKMFNEVKILVNMTDQTQNRLRRVNKQFEDLTSLDGLTQIPNRQRFDDYLDEEWAHSINMRIDLSVLMIDVDYFKAYNDNYGHPAGDECLARVASALAGTTRRPMDMVARYGGEEFAVVLPNTDSAGAKIIAEHLREEVEALSIPHEHSNAADVVTVSIGIATDNNPNPESSPKHLVQAADKMLYESKKGGRNMVSLAETL